MGSDGGYSTLISFILSVIIMILAFWKRAMFLAYSFLLAVGIMVAYAVIFQSGQVLTAIHVAQIGRILPYAVILWLMIKAKNNGNNQQ